MNCILSLEHELLSYRYKHNELCSRHYHKEVWLGYVVIDCKNGLARNIAPFEIWSEFICPQYASDSIKALTV